MHINVFSTTRLKKFVLDFQNSTKYYGAAESGVEKFASSRRKSPREQLETAANQFLFASEQASSQKFQCLQCGMNFKTEVILKRHSLMVHMRQFPHYCSVCGKGVSSKVNLAGHMATKHDNSKKYYCKTCGKEFAYKRSLQDHWMTGTCAP